MVAVTSSQAHILSTYTTHRKKIGCQLACTVAAVAIPIILSLGGLLPAAVWKIGAVVTCIFPVKLITSWLLSKALPDRSQPTKYIEQIITMGPLHASITTPVIEETLFRGILQGGLTVGLRKIVPLTLVSLFGMPTFLSTLLAATIASTAFGLMHAGQSPMQAIITGLGSLVLEAPLFHLYGLWASCLAHIVNNTLCYLFMVASWETSRAK